MLRFSCALALVGAMVTAIAAHQGLPDEGDTSLVHACTQTRRKGKVRMRFVSPTGRCGGKWTAVHWPLGSRFELRLDPGSGIVTSPNPVTGNGTISVDAPTCPDTQKLVWTGTGFACAPDQLGGPPAGTLFSLTITGSGLKPRESDVVPDVDSSGGCTFVASGDASTVWNTPVNLPDGSVVRFVRMHYKDTSASNTTAWFTKYDLDGSIPAEYSVSSTGNAGLGSSDSEAIDETIDYDAHGYHLNWRPIVTGSTMQLCALQIFYEPPPE